MVWSGIVVGKARKNAYVPYDLYSYFMREDSLVHSSDWGLQKQYFHAFTHYLELARKMTPDVVNEIELATFQSFIEREKILHKAGALNSIAMREIRNAAKRCNITISKILRSGYQARRKGIMLLSHFSFPLGCSVRRMMIR